MEEKKQNYLSILQNAIEGNEISKCDIAAEYQAKAGLVDFKGSEEDVLAQIRALVTMLPANNEDDMSYEECTDDLNRVCKDLANCAGDTSIALSQISDNNVFFEVKADYAKDMVCGFIKLNGSTVGAVANRTEIYDAEGNLTETMDAVLSARGARKAADFVKFCDAFNIPVLDTDQCYRIQSNQML